jgi:hypothetical protein
MEIFQCFNFLRRTAAFYHITVLDSSCPYGSQLIVVSESAVYFIGSSRHCRENNSLKF